MYQYTDADKRFVAQRVEEFRSQVERRLDGRLSEDAFKPLRLMNGLYLQTHAYMLRVAIPYGTLSSQQMRAQADIARRYDRGYAHFTTRQNIQFNWVRLDEAPDILQTLADVEMHAIQTSGNCIRNTTTDHLAGVTPGELEDPRPWCELIRQWSTLHPEFSFLPRKFKIAVIATREDRAAIRFHDIGLRMIEGPSGERGFQVFVGGGMGRLPRIGQEIRPFVPELECLTYLEAILRIYNEHGRRDNKYRSRIKILVGDLGIDRFRQEVEAEFDTMDKGALEVPESTLKAIEGYFRPPTYADYSDDEPLSLKGATPRFRAFLSNNVHSHKVLGYRAVTISLKPEGGIPGDASHAQLDLMADLADRYGFGELRISHEQNVILPDVPLRHLPALFEALESAGLGTPNAGRLTDIIACPGLDYCSIANARSIPVAQSISERLGDLAYLETVGELKIKISGCINACAHHHAGHIGILGINKKGQELYQLMLGGDATETTSLGRIIGPGFSREEVVDVVEAIVNQYLNVREPEETFLEAVRRLGVEPFKEVAYARH